MAPHKDRPMAAEGLTSYRYPSAYSAYGDYVMIGARDDAEALREAERSIGKTCSREFLQIWNPSVGAYRPVYED